MCYSQRNPETIVRMIRQIKDRISELEDDIKNNKQCNVKAAEAKLDEDRDKLARYERELVKARSAMRSRSGG